MALTPIPNITIGQEYDQRYADAAVHYDALRPMADFFGRNMPVHHHDRFFQVHYINSGMVRVYLDNRQYHQQGPMFFLTPPGIPHSFTTEEGSDGHVLTVRQQLVWSLLDECPDLGSIGQITPVCVATGHVSSEARHEVARIERLFDELGAEFAAERKGRDVALTTLTRLLFISLFRLSANSLKAQHARHDELMLFHRFNLEIEAHFKAHWTLSAYASALNVTEARLNSVCRRIAGVPSKRLVHERLMQEARRMLTFTGMTVNEIGYQLGFQDPAYFCRFFARHADTTPSNYRHHQLSQS
ncbi:4-hydroxyphenylacetate catabolism regulatory protein HpaA [Halomonas sp. FeN2]|uniref:4-hydroxyphenylacetate catabolism regulatory protein HpaA n=1 Tax=Vreelandella neptunia TaxID=115551 RepID=A0ABZ0YLB8_9GAMM|nr:MULTISPECIES: 4-hydroxyphenylacetate catabolism regulatory protein HpaA [Halomonas]MBF56326.1 4-hydroxyphenylacetate catabolism regulatory protein HpaA [Halomonas sp.]MDN3562170.1 4-hydroxyphenylacetate catabolism regulatory protein HpaA [Halomonas neptunia]UBR51622.1 4-hydroxyphenylacetate catabolism regulatory protein HpaA [Halomonas sp. FeN2]WQH12289.1 4-hydroxyphenylacetate catabolism regulatory protein HpaA [Halomonas neptunia]|tara:strand:+ start:42 stop:941 length:900 start_codon:yes stop_codon:yes gene_type:complete